MYTYVITINIFWVSQPNPEHTRIDVVSPISATGGQRAIFLVPFLMTSLSPSVTREIGVGAT